MASVKVKIIEYVDDSQPGWVRCVLTDTQNKNRFFTEKVPIVTTMYLDDKSKYPQEGIINCVITNEYEEGNFIDIETSKPIGIYSEDEKATFTIFRDQLINI